MVGNERSHILYAKTYLLTIYFALFLCSFSLCQLLHPLQNYLHASSTVSDGACIGQPWQVIFGYALMVVLQSGVVFVSTRIAVAAARHWPHLESAGLVFCAVAPAVLLFVICVAFHNFDGCPIIGQMSHIFLFEFEIILMFMIVMPINFVCSIASYCVAMRMLARLDASPIKSPAA